jgi:drug/metabolite transporter (DMT)-like permease
MAARPEPRAQVRAAVEPQSPKSGRPPVALVLAAFAAVYVIWGSTYLGIRYAIETLPPFLMAGARFLIAGLLMMLWARASGAGRPTRRQALSACVVGALLFVGGNGGVVWAEQYIASGVVALLIATEPLWIAILK